uniref:Zinc metalloproteinase n=1 Tax=Strongyloides papillosus TaxID=174720 RepID=A0A0N5BHF4_STREA
MNLFVKLFLFFLSIQKAISNNEGSLKAYGNSESYGTRIKRSIMNYMRLKWTSPIDYHINHDVDKNTVKTALKIMERETCLRFHETTNFTKGGLNYVNGSGCVSFVGKVSSSIAQDVSLGKECNLVTVALHETSHALGVIHEMTRHDRDYYINVKFGNIDPRVHFNFQTFGLTRAYHYGLKYDYGSVMHYDRLAGSANEQLAMEPKHWSYLKTIGQTTRFGFNDAKQLNIYYCNDKCKKKLKCKMGGYTDPNNCTVCKCPEFYTGKLCQKLSLSHKSCGSTKLITKTTDKELKAEGIKTCYFQITAKKGRKVQLNIEETNLVDGHVCQPNRGLEVKFLSDKAISGAMLCGRIYRKIITSEDNVVAMKYVGLTQSSRIRIKYREI